MAQGKKLDTETKVKIIEAKINNPDLSSRDIASNVGVGKSAVAEVIEDIPNYFAENPDKHQIYIDKINAKFTGINVDGELKLDKEIFNEYCEYIGEYRKAKEYIEGFMLQSLGRGYIKRKSINRDTRYGILERAGFKCQACGAKPRPENDIELEIDHIIPYSMGGICTDNNYQVLCKSCNSSKGNSFIFDHN